MPGKQIASSSFVSCPEDWSSITEDSMRCTKVEYEYCRPVDSPERTLLAAILVRALLDLQPGVPQENRRDAIYWFLENNTEKRLTSFTRVVEELELDYRMMRKIKEQVAVALEFETLRTNIARESKSKGETDRKVISKLAEGEWGRRRPQEPTVRRRPGRLIRYRGPQEPPPLPHRIEGNQISKAPQEYLEEMV